MAPPLTRMIFTTMSSPITISSWTLRVSTSMVASPWLRPDATDPKWINAGEGPRKRRPSGRLPKERGAECQGIGDWEAWLNRGEAPAFLMASHFGLDMNNYTPYR